MKDGQFENYESTKNGLSQTIQSGTKSVRSIHNNQDIEHLNDNYQSYEPDSLRPDQEQEVSKRMTYYDRINKEEKKFYQMVHNLSSINN